MPLPSPLSLHLISLVPLHSLNNNSSDICALPAVMVIISTGQQHIQGERTQFNYPQPAIPSRCLSLYTSYSCLENDQSFLLKSTGRYHNTHALSLYFPFQRRYALRMFMSICNHKLLCHDTSRQS